MLILTSCKDSLKKTDLNNAEQVVIKGDYFETAEAENLNNQGVEYARKGYIEKGNELFKKAESIEPNNPTILNNLGNSNSYMEKHSEAINYFSKALKVSDSTYLSAGSNLSLEFFKIGKYNKGVQIADYVIRKSDNEFHTIAARIHKSFNLTRLGKCEKAKSELRIIRDKSKTVNNLDDQIEIMESRIKNCVQQGL